MWLLPRHAIPFLLQLNQCLRLSFSILGSCVGCGGDGGGISTVTSALWFVTHFKSLKAGWVFLSKSCGVSFTGDLLPPSDLTLRCLLEDSFSVFPRCLAKPNFRSSVAACFLLPAVFADFSFFCNPGGTCCCLTFMITRPCLKDLLYHDADHVANILHQDQPFCVFDATSCATPTVNILTSAARASYFLNDNALSFTNYKFALSSLHCGGTCTTLSKKIILQKSPIDITALTVSLLVKYLVPSITPYVA